MAKKKKKSKRSLSFIIVIGTIVVVALVLAVILFSKTSADKCSSNLDTSACDSLNNSKAILSCYENMSYYKNDACICNNLNAPDKQNCFIDFATKTKNENICKLNAFDNSFSDQGYGGKDVCYYKLVVENANLFSRRWHKEDIIRLCDKIDNSALQTKCFSAKGFAINESKIKD